VSADSISHRLVEARRYDSQNIAWRTFLRWALVEDRLPEVDCRRALEWIADGERERATSSELSVFEAWLLPWSRSAEVMAAASAWAQVE
jgi:hypothetical protein